MAEMRRFSAASYEPLVTTRAVIGTRVVITAPIGTQRPSKRGAEHDEREVRRGAAAEHCPVAEPPPPVAPRATIDGHAP